MTCGDPCSPRRHCPGERIDWVLGVELAAQQARFISRDPPEDDAAPGGAGLYTPRPARPAADARGIVISHTVADVVAIHRVAAAEIVPMGQIEHHYIRLARAGRMPTFVQGPDADGVFPATEAFTPSGTALTSAVAAAASVSGLCPPRREAPCQASSRSLAPGPCDRPACHCSQARSQSGGLDDAQG